MRFSLITAAGLLTISQMTFAATIIDMPPPPEMAKSAETEPAPAAEAEAEPEPDVGDIALIRYSRMRQTPSDTYGPAYAWWGWPGNCGRAFPCRFYGYRPHYPNDPAAYVWPGRYGCFTGAYRISISPWTFYGRRNRFGNYVYP